MALTFTVSGLLSLWAYRANFSLLLLEPAVKLFLSIELLISVSLKFVVCPAGLSYNRLEFVWVEWMFSSADISRLV